MTSGRAGRGSPAGHPIRLVRAVRFLVGALIALTLVTGEAAPFSGGRPFPDSLQGTVTFVYDGDTIRVRLDSGGDRKVRLIGLDTPEMDDAREEVRFLAFIARRFALSRLHRRPVVLTFDREREDAYGRLLAYVWTGSGEMFNEVAVAEGYGFALLKYPFDEAIRERLRQAERAARLAGKGLWRREPYPEIAPGQASGWVGKLASVRFRCVRVFERNRFLVLRPSGGGFETVIPRSVLDGFPAPREFAGRTVVVTGFIEIFNGVPQVVVGVPLQVKPV